MPLETENWSLNLKTLLFHRQVAVEIFYRKVFLKYYNLDITIVATKYDKVSKNSRIKQDKLIKDTLKFDDNEFITFSTVTKKGRSEVLSIIEEKI